MMDIKKKRRLIQIVVSAAVLLAGFFILNYFLAKRLERYLRKELVERTSDATNNFYTLAFDSLSINLLNGELRMAGIRLSPDPVTFDSWKAKDSLPPVYVDAEIGLIDFKGVNLIWRRNYRHLAFRTFEIKQPIVKVTGSLHSGQVETKPSTAQPKTLYEMVSPYINVLTVRKMNLENARVFYDVEDPVSPIHYELDDVSFHAYGFRLDADSYDNGKLLYCDDFDFTTNQKQQLLKNNSIIFATDSISLDTRKKVVHIGNASLTPQKQLWEQGIPQPDNTMDGSIEAIRIKDIEFFRKDRQNSLYAGSFEVIHPNVKGRSIIRKDSISRPVPPKKDENYINADLLIQKMSLYEIISPIFHNITINSIGIDKARLHYTIIENDSTDIYSLENLNFETRGFTIDSLTSLAGQSRYYKYISLEATGMNATLASQNQTIDLKRIALDTEEERMYIENLVLGTLSAHNRKNIFSGKVDTVSLEGVDYKNGVNARQFRISGVDIDYYLSPDSAISLQMPQLALNDLSLDTRDKDPVIRMGNLHVEASNIRLSKTSKPATKTDVRFNHLDIKNFNWDKNGYTIDSVDMSMEHLYTVRNGRLSKQVNDTVRMNASGLSMDRTFKKYKVNNIEFDASNISIPVDNGFYTLNIQKISLKNRNLRVDNLHYISTYPQLEFSFKHPKHSDWFDIQVGHIALDEIDIPALWRDTALIVKEATVNDMTLQNMKNQKIVLPRRIVPMVYEGIQKAPIKLDIPLVKVSNFAVVYYELPQKGDVPGRLSITDVNGTISGLTNRATQPEQFFRIQANAKFMGTGDFTATWLMPVSPQYDRFVVDAHLKQFNLKDLNAFISPLAGAEVESGFVHDMTLQMDASSTGGTIFLHMPYRDLKVEIGKAFTSWLANVAIRNNNPPHPDKPDSEIRESHLTITRNPYHSTFNYLWQMISPALIESVGIPEGTQKFGKGVSKAIKGIKNFFTGNKDEKKKEKENKK